MTRGDPMASIASIAMNRASATMVTLVLGLTAGLTPTARAQTAPSQPAQPLPACAWEVLAFGATSNYQVARATFLDMGADIMLMFTSRDGGTRPGATAGGWGTIVMSGIGASGQYTVSGPTPGGSGSGGMLDLPNPQGGREWLAPGNGLDERYNGQVIGTQPAPATLIIWSHSSTDLYGVLWGDFIDLKALGTVPPTVVTVPVQVLFNARLAMPPGSCP